MTPPDLPRPTIPDGFALGSFLSRWSRGIRHDLTASECETLPLRELLCWADPLDRRRWQDVSLGYADPRGAPWLRAAIAARHEGRTPEEVLCCAGAQEAVTCIARALLGPHDHAVVILPIYQPSEMALRAAGPVAGVTLRERGGWHLDLDEVAAAIRPRTRLLLMNFPNSPTGATLDRATLDALIALCRRHGLWLVSDEVYRATETDPSRRLPMAADLYERGISINAMSKSFGLPGLRVGWLVCQDPDLLNQVMLHKSTLSSSLAAPSEVLAHIALGAEPRIIARNRAIAAANRALLDGFFCRHPDLFREPTPAQAAWAFPRYLGPDGADAFAARLAQDAGVLVLPSSLWRTPLADVPLGHLRIGLGRHGFAAALAALEAHVSRLDQPAAKLVTAEP
jgi:aspartate/methionine/tyrosine aminotransferase